MKINVRFFASLREALGPGQTLELDESTTVGGLRDRLMASSAAHAHALGRKAVRAALNQELCGDDAMIDGDAEVAFFPPVTGG